MPSWLDTLPDERDKRPWWVCCFMFQTLVSVVISGSVREPNASGTPVQFIEPQDDEGGVSGAKKYADHD